MTSLSKVGVTEASLNLSNDAYVGVSQKLSLKELDQAFSAFMKPTLEHNFDLRQGNATPTINNENETQFKPK